MPHLIIKSSGARQNAVNAHIFLPGTHSFWQAHAFEVWTPTSTYCQFIICVLYMSEFHAEQVVKYHILQFSFTMLMGLLICGSFIVHALLPGMSKAFSLSGFFRGTHIHILLLGTWYDDHDLIISVDWLLSLSS